MYLTAASAAWRYSGNVTGPDSRFSRPSVIGVPVAFFAVPSTDVSAVGVLVEPELAAPFDEDELLPLEPHPAASAATATSAATFVVTFNVVLLMVMVRARPPRPRPGSSSARGHAGRAARRPRPPARAARG